jgi:predicted nucleic acid-binding protein
VGKKTKVVIDNNVLVSAFGWHGKPEEVVKLMTTGKIVNFCDFCKRLQEE